VIIVLFAFCVSALTLFLQRRDKRPQLSITYEELLKAGGSRADAGNGTLKSVAVSIDPQYGTVGSFRPPRVTGTRWSALLALERGTTPGVVGSEGKRHT
jgi:hypothetical protein